MSTIIPASPPTIAVTVPAPSDGDTANAASLAQFVQPLENSAEAFRLLTYGGGIRRRVVCVDNNTMTIQPLGAIVVTLGGVWYALVHTTASTVSPTTMAGGSLTNSTRYWVYAYSAAGVLSFVADTTGPDVGLRYKNADTDKQYVTTFYVDSVGTVIPYEQNDNAYFYQDIDNNGNRVLSLGNATVQTTVALGNETPSQASSVLLYAFSDSSGAARRGYVYVTGGFNGFSVSDDGATIPQQQGIIPLTSGKSFSYKVSNAGMHLSVYVVGFWL